MKVKSGPILNIGALFAPVENTPKKPLAASELSLPLAPWLRGPAKPVNGGGQGFSAGGLYQHQLKSGVDFEKSMTTTMDLARGTTEPALKQTAIALVEAFFSSRGVRTSRTPQNDLRIEPDSRTPYGRYAMFAAKHCGVSVVVDPTDTAGASFDANAKTIRISCDDIPKGKPGLNDLHEMVHASFATTPAAGKHPLSGKNYRAEPDIPILGYERGYSRDEMMTYAMQGQHTQTLQVNALYDKVANGAGTKSDLKMVVDSWADDQSLVYCSAFAVDIYLTASDLKKAVQSTSFDQQLDGFIMNSDGSRSVMTTPLADTVRVSASGDGKTMWFHDDGLRADNSADAMTRSFVGSADAACSLAGKQLDALDRSKATRQTMLDLLASSAAPRLDEGERSEFLALLQQLKKDLKAVRDVTLPPGTPLLPKGFDVLEAEIIGAPLAN